MAIDYVIDHLCAPKDAFTTGGILARLKGRDQADRIIQLYKDSGEGHRPYDQMGFEMARSTPDGKQETQIIRVSEILEATQQLDPFAHHCTDCVANLQKKPFGCFGRINYPLSDNGERWLLMQLPQPHEALLVWTMLGENLRDLNIQSQQVQDIRESGSYMESLRNPRRKLGEIAVSGNNLFYLLFMQGHITPSRAAVLLLFFNVISRNIDANDIYKLTPAPKDVTERYPFLLKPEPDIDDETVTELKTFFRALYTAWTLGIDLQLDV